MFDRKLFQAKVVATSAASVPPAANGDAWALALRADAASISPAHSVKQSFGPGSHGMRIIHLVAAVAVATLLLAAAHALAQEGSGDPFANAVAGTTTLAGTPVADADLETYPDIAGRPSSTPTVIAGAVLSGQGSEASVQTDNSLPFGFEQGTAAYTQAQLAQRHFADQAERNRIVYKARAAAESARN